MVSFNGLESLQSIGGDFALLGNDAFVNFNGLERLKTVGGFFLTTGEQTIGQFQWFDAIEICWCILGGKFSKPYVARRIDIIEANYRERYTVGEGRAYSQLAAS